MNIHFLRHATSIITLNGLRILVDPMLSEAGAMDPIANAGNDLRIPLVPLPLSTGELQQLLRHIDVILVTHTHRDHWDARAQELLPKHLPLLCQPEDEDFFKRAGFSQVQSIIDSVVWRGISISRTGGHHGTGELGKRMGPVSGFVLKAEGAPSLYIAGDTVWCSEVQQVLAQFSPDLTMLYTGAATYATGGGPITMNDDDVVQVCQAAPNTKIIAVHLETVNHCRLTRAALKVRIEKEGLEKHVLIPADGDVLTF